MSTIKKIVATGALVVMLVLGVLAYNVFRAPAAATTPIQATPLALSAAGASGTSTAATTAPTEAATTAGAATAGAATAGTAAAAETTAPATSSSTVLQIVQAESEARFVIDEVLNNAPKTVVGTTDQVAGEIAIDPADPTQSRVGVIQVNARTLATDSEFRDRAIKNAILQTDQYEFITFTPMQLVGLPQTGAVGQTYTFQMVGDLTIRDVTRSVTFDVTVTPASESRLAGTATTTILYADYGITIPQARSVASIEDDVRLEIDFVAVPA